MSKGKGVRDFVNAKFAELLPQMKELTPTGFRKAVMQAAMTEHGVSISSAATHYNFSLKATRLANPAAVEGLGRPEDKKGGRPVTNPVTVVTAKNRKEVIAGVSRGKANDLIAAAKLKNRNLAILEDLVAADEKAAKKAAEEAAKAAALGETVAA